MIGLKADVLQAKMVLLIWRFSSFNLFICLPGSDKETVTRNEELQCNSHRWYFREIHTRGMRGNKEKETCGFAFQLMEGGKGISMARGSLTNAPTCPASPRISVSL